MSEEEPPNHPEQEDRKQGQTERRSIEEQIGAPLRNLSGQIASLRAPFRDFSDHVTSFTDVIKHNTEEEQTERRVYQTDQLYWLRFGTIGSIVSSVLGFAVALVTLLILQKTLNVADRQREITEGQLGVMSKQLKEMEDAGKQTDKLLEHAATQAEAAKASADAAKTSADIAKKTGENYERSFRLQQRPYVIVAGLDLNTPLKEGENNITLTLRNAGRTPGFKTEVISKVILFGAKAERLPMEQSRSIIADQPITTPITLTLNTVTFQRIISGSIRLQIDGEVLYSDIFKELHRTKFCGFYNVQRQGFSYCGSGNELE